MKTTLLAGLGLTIVSSLGFAGCTSSADDADECLPGDIDCSTDGQSGGKADGFDFKNDPVRMSQNLNYRLAELPKSGKRTVPFWKDQYPEAVGKSEPAWADTYWPTVEGSHNARWQGPSEKSPLEKYDAAFNNAPGCATQPAIFGPGAKAAWDTYKKCAGPATKWQATVFQGADALHDGKDNDADGKIDDEGDNGDIDGLASWWGTCHAWTPASMLVPEPQHAVTVNGVTFAVGDIKALIQNVFDQTDAVMLGGRCNAKEIKHDVNGSANDDCADVNPGALHVILTNYLGIAQLPLVEDRTANFEVWNQPVTGYEVTKQDEVSATVANKCVGATGSTWKFNTKAKKLVEVRNTVEYVTEAAPSAEPVGFHNNRRFDRNHYILELNDAGKIIGGRYCSDSENTHTDFLWAPTGRFNPSNPNVDVAKVKELIAKSVASEGGGTGPAKTFAAMPNKAIPDNNPAGISDDLAVTGVTGTVALTVSVNISHTFRGDLVVDLLKNGTKVKTLVNQQGGSAHDIVQSFTVGSSDVGAANATWTLKVTDVAAQDVGTLNSWKLEFR